MAVIAVQDLQKTYYVQHRREGIWGGLRDLVHRETTPLTAVNDISFSVEQGELIGFIGPNGAGKSTTIKMLTGILKPSGGTMEVLGYHPFRQRHQYTQHIGVVFGQRTQLWWDIAVIESLKLLAEVYRVPPNEYQERLALLDKILSLSPLLRTPVRKLSLGQRMRCDLAASLIHNPRILFLDEPTIGLDAIAKYDVRGFLRQINRDFGATIILTTHDLAEIEELCSRILIIDKGTLIFNGPLSRLKALPGVGRQITVDFAKPVEASELHAHFNGMLQFTLHGHSRVTSYFNPQRISSANIVATLLSHYEIIDFAVSEPNIEEVIMRVYRGEGQEIGSTAPQEAMR